ncbi:hypothetical protein SAMN05720761_10431 [Fibrobacter sp. UWCM]|uniref:hypothetical protein n=1 Tax=unclassified Fibrobacter TaxID=2634177 RepID=UPI00091B245F|nr:MULTISPECIES: hypothetical protein [unclassified Fibrobacter]SHG68455.1 hypothetical protein SAMN05720761_10431 [Fibrobacter sp. UWCM]SHM86552.1 hypothetical protein SAMN05720472_2490 [Fibrobacter sp. UWR3]
MKIKFFVAGLAVASLAVLSGCAGGAAQANRSVTLACEAKTIAEEASADSLQMLSANTKLDSAKALEAAGKNEEAVALADQSALEYRLAIATAERDAAKKEDERVEAELRSEVERKLIYQSILDQETKKAEAK